MPWNSAIIRIRYPIRRGVTEPKPFSPPIPRMTSRRIGHPFGFKALNELARNMRTHKIG